MKNDVYALHIGSHFDKDYNHNSFWYKTLSEAMANSFAAIEAGVPERMIEVTKFDEDSGDVLWDFPIVFNKGAWSDYLGAFDELQSSSYSESDIVELIPDWKVFVSDIEWSEL